LLIPEAFAGNAILNKRFLNLISEDVPWAGYNSIIQSRPHLPPVRWNDLLAMAFSAGRQDDELKNVRLQLFEWFILSFLNRYGGLSN
jgi:hypothetical protein